MRDEEYYSYDISEDYYVKNIIQMRYNGKFFTGVFFAKSAKSAFDEFIETLLENGHIKEEQIEILSQLGFKNTLVSADEGILSFMWNRALEAEKDDTKIIYSIFDGNGWSFFGRI